MNITFHRFGSQALLIQWEQRIDRDINAAVVRLAKEIEQAKIPGITYCLPAYCSLTVGYRSPMITYDLLCREIEALISAQRTLTSTMPSPRQITIPVCYEGPCAPDLEWLSEHTGLDCEQIISLHTSTPFHVYLIGFLPGFPYLATLPSVLHAPRKETPRLRVPAGSVALAGLQTGIYPLESPGGWQIIGRTPVRLFDPKRESPFYLQTGDEVRFEAIGWDAFQHASD
ncbi:MAG: 5-oxoprolinase subunit PxpB [Saprospiraceae bacterium]|nr:5-oxoprolinase subunit PxpB [Lewinella sp.]